MTIPEVMDKVSIWTEPDSRPDGRRTASNPYIPSLRRNIQRSHLGAWWISPASPTASVRATASPASPVTSPRTRGADRRDAQPRRQPARSVHRRYPRTRRSSTGSSTRLHLQQASSGRRWMNSPPSEAESTGTRRHSTTRRSSRPWVVLHRAVMSASRVRSLPTRLRSVGVEDGFVGEPEVRSCAMPPAVSDLAASAAAAPPCSCRYLGRLNHQQADAPTRRPLPSCRPAASRPPGRSRTGRAESSKPLSSCGRVRPRGADHADVVGHERIGAAGEAGGEDDAREHRSRGVFHRSTMRRGGPRSLGRDGRRGSAGSRPA